MGENTLPTAAVPALDNGVLAASCSAWSVLFIGGSLDICAESGSETPPSKLERTRG